ncbi:MAG: ATP-binding protein [Chlorobiaceae bacterium]
MSEITCAAQVDRLAEIAQFVDACAEHFQLDAAKTFGLQVAVEEIFVNICSYAYPDEEGVVSIIAGREDDALVLEIADNGIPFNIMLLPDPDTSLDISDRNIGGLGGYFVRRLTDNVTYRRDDGKNILKISMLLT